MKLDRPRALQILSRVPYPGFTRDIVASGVVADVVVEPTRIAVILRLPDGEQAVQQRIEQAIRAALAQEAAGRSIEVTSQHVVAGGSSSLNVLGSTATAARAGSADPGLIPTVAHVIAVASGKGGVGKSTVAVNLAVALARGGARVGLLDADIYGPSVPLMMGLQGERPRLDASGSRLIPFERYGVRLMSIGFLVEADSAVIWRGPMVMKALEQLLRDVVWGDLDYLVLDLPPGTGDAQLTLSQRVRLSGAVIVSTPQDVALADAVKGVAMFRKLQVPVLGLVENMSHFTCPHCHERTDIFSHGGARDRARSMGVPFLGELPLDARIRETGDAGRPIVDADPDSDHARAFVAIAGRVVAALDPPAGGAGGTAGPGWLMQARQKLGLGGKSG